MGGCCSISDICLVHIHSHTQNIHIHCDTSRPNDCLSVCRHHGIGGCTSVRPVLGTLYVVNPQYLLVLCQRSSNLLPCKLTGCWVGVGWCHGTCDWQCMSFDHLLLFHWSQLWFIWLTKILFNTFSGVGIYVITRITFTFNGGQIGQFFAPSLRR